jgi:hypothetical protein
MERSRRVDPLQTLLDGMRLNASGSLMGTEFFEANRLTLSQHAAQRIRSAARAATLQRIASAVACFAPGNAGTRLLGSPLCGRSWHRQGR